MVELRGISWVGVPVDDFEGAVGFFRDQLGVPLTKLDEEREIALFPLINGDLVELFGPKNTTEEHRRHIAFAFEVDDIEAARSELESGGVKFVTEIRTWQDQAWCYFEGPDGLLFEIKAKEDRS